MLLALLITSCICSCGIGLTEGAKISEHENPKRPETTTHQGKIRGINMVTRRNRKIFGFLGVPYAQPPVGDLRFRAPVPAGPWEGTLDASKDSDSCIQFSEDREIVGNEDCLYHNVYTPQLPASGHTTLLPVMMYISGGGFVRENASSTTYDPHFLLDANIVLIVPHVRVGIIGYLTTGDKVAPGNYGLKDIVRCLEWVQENIQYFGGDRNQVTLFGGSTGAMSVHLLALSKLTDGLFHKFITQSGSAFSNTANQRRDVSVSNTVRLGKYLRCPTKTSEVLVKCLRNFKASQLVEIRSLFEVWKIYPVNIWLPTTEPDIEGALLTDTPANLYAAGKIRDLPWIALVNRDEGINSAIYLAENLNAFGDFLDNIDLALPLLLDYHSLVDVDNVTAYTDRLKSYYLNDLTADKSILLKNYSKLVGDGLFGYSVYRAIKQQHLLAKGPQYFGCFEYKGIFSYTYFYGHNTEYKEVSHGDELMYLFGHQGDLFGPPGADYSETDHLIIDTLVSLWTSFATRGCPTTPNSISSVTWKPYSSRNNYLRIGNGSDPSLEMQYDLNLERMQFWDELVRTLATSKRP